MWTKATIIRIEDNEVDCLFTHLAFGVRVSCSYLAKTPSICGPLEKYVLSNHLLSCWVKRYKKVCVFFKLVLNPHS